MAFLKETKQPVLEKVAFILRVTSYCMHRTSCEVDLRSTATKFWGTGVRKLFVRISSVWFVDDPVINNIIIYLQTECIDKCHVELCSKYDREHDFDVTLR